MIGKIKLDKNTLISSILTLITILIWIGLDVYRALTKTTITKVTQEQMQPLEPKIKKDVIQELKSNLSFSEEELKTMSIILKEEAVSLEEAEEIPVATRESNLE